jgi:hypothetical protein
MAVIIARVTEHDPSNIHIGGKVIFVPAERRKAAQANFPAGTVAKVTTDNTGTAISIQPPTEQEMATFTRNEVSQKPLQKPTPAVNPVTREAHVQTPSTTPAAPPKADKEATNEAPVAHHECSCARDGTIISVMIGGTINLGNFNNVKLEVTATSGEAARAAYQQEISSTVEMMKGIIRQVGVTS